MPRVIVDFETEAIGLRSQDQYPPLPVGLAVRQGSKNTYLSWGHDSDNNCTRKDAEKLLRSVWKQELVFHNAAFDIEVAMKYFSLPWPEKWHDTLLLAYLADPRAPSFGLKPLSESWLGMPPDEQDALKDWVLANVKGATKKTWGGYIARSPGGLAGQYAKGDVIRTGKLFTKLYAHIKKPLPDMPEVSMLDAYEREKKVLMVKVDMERTGIAMDKKRLSKDTPAFQDLKDKVEGQLRKVLKVTPKWAAAYDGGWNIDSGEHLADALEHSGYVNPKHWARTKTGRRSTARDSLIGAIKNDKILSYLNTYAVVSKYLSTFLIPWQDQLSPEGRLHTSFNTTRSTNDEGRMVGTSTGRLSSSNPNLQNIGASVEESAHSSVLIPLQKILRKDYGVEFIGLRDYFISDRGKTFINRDYSQQEFRILAHFEYGSLMDRYVENPRIDFHTLVQTMVQEATGKEYPRKPIKNINFGIIYGMGVALLADKTGLSVEDARALKNLILDLIPGIGQLQRDLKSMARAGEPISTYGGRLYYCEPPKMIQGELRTFDYKLMNLLVQGSAADSTKQAMIQVHEELGPGYLQLQVHDELMASVETGEHKKKMQIMKEAMEHMPQLDIPMLTDGKVGKTWARMKDDG